MKSSYSLALFAAVILVPASPAGQTANPPSLTGLWDLTITTSSESYPSWLDIAENGGQPHVRIGGRVASVHPADQASLDNGQLTFMSHEYIHGEQPVIWEVHMKDGRLMGTQRLKDGTTGQIVGDPSPALDRPVPASWSKPEPLFNGKDLTGWEPFLQEPGKSPVNHYVARNGELVNEAPGANIKTTRKFNDFKLHIEYNCPNKGNSGVYLRGRYELQVEYEGETPTHNMGSVYGFLAPSQALPPKPGEWESFDVTLVGRIVTVVRDGKTIIDREVIPGITGGALDSHEAEPGPIYIQGDHTGGMKYRNITISVPQQ